MKALFVHDHRFYTMPSGAVYSPGKLPYTAWQRYLKEFDELTVVGRSRGIIDVRADRLSLSSGQRVSFVFLPDIASPLRFLFHRSDILDALQREIGKVDAVIARTSFLGELAAMLARKNGKPYAIEVVGDAWEAYWNYGNIHGKVYAPIAWFTLRRCLAKADYAIYVTREYLQRRYPCHGLTAYASNVDINPVAKDVLDEKISRWGNRPSGENKHSIKIGFSGSLVNRYKGLHIALRALNRLKRQGVETELHVLGEGISGPWRAEAEVLGVADLVHFCGVVPSGDSVAQWIDGLDGYIQPSLQEGLPRSLIEAMSRGLPALGSKCGGIPELLPSECLHTTGDDKTLAEQLARMVTDPLWRMKEAERNFREARHYYHEEIDARRSAFWNKFAESVRQRRVSAQ